MRRTVFAGCHARKPTVVEFGVQEFVSFFATVDKVGQLQPLVSKRISAKNTYNLYSTSVAFF